MKLALYTAGAVVVLVLIGVCWAIGQIIKAIRGGEE